MNINEPYIEGLQEIPEAPDFMRYSRALRRYFESCTLPAYNGGFLYPCGGKYNDDYAVYPDYSFTFSVNMERLGQKSRTALEFMQNELGKIPFINSVHTVGGNIYTHSIPHFGRIMREGLNSYETRIKKCPDSVISDGLLDVLAGLRCYHARILEKLSECGGRTELVNALRKVPFFPASTYYEALVCMNFIYYSDFCDNLGRLDSELANFYHGEDLTEVLRELFVNVDVNSGWTGALGPDYNAVTLQCLRAAAGLRRPSLELRVRENMPDEVWAAACECIISGCGQPSLYNEDLYQSAFHEIFPFIPKSDLMQFCGGGCTESMLTGISNVGSLDAGINLAHILSQVMKDELPFSDNFEHFYSKLRGEIKAQTLYVLSEINRCKRERALYRPQPMRTLLIDDCIDRGLDYNNGGARYYWSVVNVAGLINVIDSLLAIKQLVFEKSIYTPETFCSLLESEDENLFRRFRMCPHYGKDNESADQFAAEFSGFVWDIFKGIEAYPSGFFLPSSIQFATYADAGRNIGPTPDGRRNGEPLCDSVSAIHGHDNLGPTAMLRSAAKLGQRNAAGTLVTNLRLSKKFVKDSLKALTLGYFREGGMQLQITCVSSEDMLAAQTEPEKHGALIVRIGGYSEYFVRLPKDLQDSVIARTLHGEMR